jgi:putative transposase
MTVSRVTEKVTHGWMGRGWKRIGTHGDGLSPRRETPGTGSRAYRTHNPTPRQPLTLEIANILDALPKRLHRSAKAALHEIYEAETRADAEAEIQRFEGTYGQKYPKAVDKLTKDRETLLTFYDFPAPHWVHLRTVNPIESTFATVRLRTRVTKGAGSRRRGLVMAFKLLDAAQDRWRRVNSPELVPLVRAGVQFKDGIQTERSDSESRDAA